MTLFTEGRLQAFERMMQDIPFKKGSRNGNETQEQGAKQTGMY